METIPLEMHGNHAAFSNLYDLRKPFFVTMHDPHTEAKTALKVQAERIVAQVLRESSAPQKPRRRACEFIENASKVRGSLTILPYELMKETIDLNHAANEVLLLHGINAQLVQETPTEVGRSSIMP